MEEKKISVDDMGIFQNQEDVVENIKESAVAVGVKTEGIDKIKDGKPLEFMVAKKNCKQCFGRGTVQFVPNEPAVRMTKREKQERRKALIHSNPLLSSPPVDSNGPVSSRDTSQPEDRAEKLSRMTTALCKCVKIQMG